MGAGGVVTMPTFADVLRKLREDSGLTQQQLAEKAGVPVGSIRNHEQGQRVPSWASVVRLARALGVPTDSFAACDEVAEPEEEPKPKKKPGGRKAK